MKKICLTAFVFTALLFSGCSELIDCVASARPNLHSKTLINGSVGVPYNDFLDSDVTNDPNDNDYDYYFEVIGNLPTGMNYRVQGRKIYFIGTPTTAGTFTFKVRLDVDPPDSYDDFGYWDDGNRICFNDDTITKEFTIIIR